ncbi:protein ALEX-like [Anastrepha ludens]|uniref:protein ALEX-like n=1 Tax=Anastrepha ludens TaxID=28586 RepID=UPI0023AFACCE|nr:protein ALEX-like [Anastrepha ludens]
MQLLICASILLSFGISTCSAATSMYDGKPGCKTVGEVGQLYRNFWDPMRYWRCVGLNMEPLQQSCPDGTGFQQSLGRCIPWKVWKWETPQYPPSCPDGVMCLSTELRPLAAGITTQTQAHLSSQVLVPSETLVPTTLQESQIFVQPQPVIQPQPFPQSQPFVQPQQFVQPQPLAESRPLQSPQAFLPKWSLPTTQAQLPKRTWLPSQSTPDPAHPLTSSRPLSPNDPYI